MANQRPMRVFFLDAMASLTNEETFTDANFTVKLALLMRNRMDILRIEKIEKSV